VSLKIQDYFGRQEVNGRRCSTRVFIKIIVGKHAQQKDIRGPVRIAPRQMGTLFDMV